MSKFADNKTDMDLLRTYMPAGFEGVVQQAAANVERSVNSVIDEYETVISNEINKATDQSVFAQKIAATDTAAGTLLTNLQTSIATINQQQAKVVAARAKAATDAVGAANDLKQAAASLDAEVKALDKWLTDMQNSANSLGQAVVGAGMSAVKKFVGLP